jgi:hypothetical protein
MNIIKSHSKKVLLPLLFSGLFSGNVMANDNSPNPVNLGSAGTFTILTKTGITDVYPSVVTGDVGSSPITGAALLLKCTEVSGNIYTADAAGPLPCATTSPSTLTSAVSDMESAYIDAAGRSADVNEKGAGKIGGLTLTQGVYKWSSDVSISSQLTISGSADDTWIFQIAGALSQASDVEVILDGGAKAENIVWQVADGVTIGTNATFQGVILSKTMIAVQTNAKVNGRLLAQTAVTLQMNKITSPGNRLSSLTLNFH